MTRPSEPGARHEARAWARAILHVDMDAFYASVEQRDRPELRGKPVIVGGTGRRGVVSSPSYEARKYGVKSAMPTFAALKLCPHATFVPPRMSRYVSTSKQVMAVFSRFTPLVEPLSLDEAFLDITGTEALFGTPVDVAWKVQRAIREELELGCSVGVAATKYVAKVASDLKKPAGLVVVPPGEERAFLEPLPLERLWGVGPKTADRLHSLGLETIGDVARLGERALVERLGGASAAGDLAAHLVALASGLDERPVETDLEPKSLGVERTLEVDIAGAERVRSALLPLVDEVAAALRARKLRAHGVRLKLKYADFRRVSRELQLPEPVQESSSILGAIEALLPRVDTKRAIRLVGLACTGLVEEGAPRQASLFAEPAERSEKLGRAMDAIKERFGQAAVARGTAPPRTR
jgi:DNA polymerase IV